MSIPGTYSMLPVRSGIEFIGTGNRTTGLSSATPVVHANTVNGDTVLIVAQCDNAYNISTPAGWTLIGSVNGTDVKGRVYSKVYAGSMPTVSLAAGFDHIILTTLTFRGVHTDVIDVANGTNTGLGFSAPYYTWATSSAVSTVSNDTFVLWMIFHEDNSNSSRFTSAEADLTNFQILADMCTSLGYNGGFLVTGGFKNAAGVIGDFSALQDFNTISPGPSNATVALIRMALKPE